MSHIEKQHTEHTRAVTKKINEIHHHSKRHYVRYYWILHFIHFLSYFAFIRKQIYDKGMQFVPLHGQFLLDDCMFRLDFWYYCCKEFVLVHSIFFQFRLVASIKTKGTKQKPCSSCLAPIFLSLFSALLFCFVLLQNYLYLFYFTAFNRFY